MTTKQIDYTILFCDAIRTEPSSERRLHSEKSASRRFFLAFRYGLTDSPSRERLLKKIFDMAADQQQFLHLLSTLLSTDNTIRSNAEVSFNILHNEKRGFAMWHAVACDEGSRQRVSHPSCVCTCGALQIFLVTHLFMSLLPFNIDYAWWHSSWNKSHLFACLYEKCDCWRRCEADGCSSFQTSNFQRVWRVLQQGKIIYWYQ